MLDILISEIFGPTLQGEGALAGRLTVFVRTGGCNSRCAWCDTLYAVLPEHRHEWVPMSAAQIIERVEQLSFGQPILVTVSGGNPALWPLGELLERGHARGHSFALETQGTHAPGWLAALDDLTLSPKPPSSGMTFEEAALRRCVEVARGGETRVSLKVVVFDEGDYRFARKVSALFPEVPFFLSVGTVPAGEEKGGGAEQITRGVEWLVERAARDGWREVTVLPQIHVLLWGQKRGV